MLRLVTTRRDELRLHLASRPFQGVAVEHVEADTADELRQAVRERPPAVVILDAAMNGGAGYELCREIARDPALPETRTILILPAGVDRGVLARVASSGCSDVMRLPLESDEFYYRVAQLAGLPIRRDRRVGVSLELSIPGYGAPMDGQVRNVSSGGLGIQLAGGLDPGMVVQLRLSHDGEVFPDTAARVAWVRPEGGVELAGLSFDRTPPLRTLLLLEQLSLYDVSAPAATSPMAGGITVALQGDFTEITDFRGLAARLEREDRIDFSAAGVRYISSAGVRAWCGFVAELSGKEYAFRHLSLAFASHAAMVPMVIGRGAVWSVEAPYVCEACDREELRLLDIACVVCDDAGVAPPVLTCATCGGALELDDLPERYFAFLLM